MSRTNPPGPWTQIALEMQHETNTKRLLELADELNRALAENGSAPLELSKPLLHP